MNYIISSVIGYFVGSIPFALVIGKLFYGVDVREHGSGNLGGSNAGRTLGGKAGASVAVLDVLKATISMTIIYFIYPNNSDCLILAGFFATIGHCFPIFAKFKGGKAVSTAIGFLLGISIFVTHNALDVIVPLVVFFLSLYLTKIVSLSSIITMFVGAIFLYFTQSDAKVSLAFSIIAAIVIARHRTNVTRIIKKEERKITWM